MPRCKKPAEDNKKEIIASTPVAKKKAPGKTGTKLSCPDCGLVVVVEEVCSCDEPCDLVCCGKPMKVKK
jgi:hypothetical protein